MSQDFPFRADVYRRRQTGTTAGRQQTRVWDKVGASVPCEVQPVSGRLESQPFGVTAEGRDKGWADSGTDVREGDGFSIVQRLDNNGVWQAVNPPTNYVVHKGMDWGAPGELELELERTSESFTT